MYVVFAALGLRCSAGSSLVRASRGSSLGAGRGLPPPRLLVSPSSADSRCPQRLWRPRRALEHKLSSREQLAWNTFLRSKWSLLGPGIKPVSPSLAGGFFTLELWGRLPRSVLDGHRGVAQTGLFCGHPEPDTSECGSVQAPAWRWSPFGASVVASALEDDWPPLSPAPRSLLHLPWPQRLSRHPALPTLHPAHGELAGWAPDACSRLWFLQPWT